MNYKYVVLLALAGISQGCVAQKPDVKEAFHHAESQTKILLTGTVKSKGDNEKLVSPRTIEDNKLKLVPSRDWTSGFFPGELWYLYEYTKNPFWQEKAEAYTANIEREKTDTGTHDLGFKVYCSAGNAYRLTGNEHYKNVVLEAAKTLITRFNPATGVIKSWDHNKDKWINPVIIDNMMNLELLFEATKLSGDSSFHKIAVSHANTTMKNHFRPDFSSYHVIDYDPETGAVLKKETHQGYSHESAWARGQAWALYGYTLSYRYTQDPAYLELAENIAGYILNHPNLPKDLVPHYDFNAPGIPHEPRDASAAAITASALFELGTYSKQGKDLLKTADRITRNLGRLYSAPKGGAEGFVLLGSTGSKPFNSEVDVPLVYADYYYMEALLRSKDAGKKNYIKN